MLSSDIRQKFLEFFRMRGHSIVPSSSLIPDDPSVLLTTAGMQQFKPYFTGELDPMKDFGSKNTVSIQKSFRTSDIDEVGDESHLTFFEMLGNFSFGGPDASGKAGASYFKKEAIEYGLEFITNVMKLKIDYVSVFEGGAGVPADEESEKIWKSLGVYDVRKFDIHDNFWGPTGLEGPCGPTTEIYVKNKNGKSIEVWNIVFNQFFYPGTREELLGGQGSKKLEKLGTPGVDTGMGLERLAMVSQSAPTIFETDLFAPLMEYLPERMDMRTKRIFADHARGAAFLIADGVRPSNKEAGYVLRRLLRRMLAYEYLLTAEKISLLGRELYGEEILNFTEKLLQATIAAYKIFYPELKEQVILPVFREESERFSKTLGAGLKELEKMEEINAQSAFRLYESHGLPYEVIKEIVAKKATKLTREGFDEEFKKHQEISRAGADKKFGGHGLILDTGELKAGNEEELNKVLRLHTATHLLQRALRDVLGAEVRQMGSDITPERTRFDFTFPRKMTSEEIKKVEDIVNQKIKEDLPVSFVELPKAEAEKSGALYFFKEKYPEKVKIYYVGKDLASAWSKEFCGGPHVAHTGEIGKFKIGKEEAVGAGTRRIRGALDG